MRYSEYVKRIILEGELRKRVYELAIAKGLAKPSIKFGRMKLRIRVKHCAENTDQS